MMRICIRANRFRRRRFRRPWGRRQPWQSPSRCRSPLLPCPPRRAHPRPPGFTCAGSAPARSMLPKPKGRASAQAVAARGPKRSEEAGGVDEAVPAVDRGESPLPEATPLPLGNPARVELHLGIRLTVRDGNRIHGNTGRTPSNRTPATATKGVPPCRHRSNEAGGVCSTPPLDGSQPEGDIFADLRHLGIRAPSLRELR